MLKKQEKDISGIHKEAKVKNDTLSEESATATLQKRVDSLTIKNKGNTATRKSPDSLIANNLSTTPIPKNKIKVKKGDEHFLAGESKFPVQKKVQLNEKQPDEVAETQTLNRIEDKTPEVLNPAGILIDSDLATNEALNPKNIEEDKKYARHLLSQKRIVAI